MLGRYEHFEEQKESPREAKERVLRDIEAGLRCKVCHLLKPCLSEHRGAVDYAGTRRNDGAPIDLGGVSF